MHTTDQRWSTSRRFILFFLTTYFFFLIMDFTSSDEILPHFIYVLLKPYSHFWDWLVPWTGQHILHLSYPITIKPNGSGDTTYNYVMQLLWVVFALLVALIWTVLDRKRQRYPQLAYWLRIVVRYYFALVLFSYGFVKIIQLQFPSPSLFRLTETYGDSSPMGLAWTFVGYSKGYNIFIGCAEVIAGALLFFKRTALFGSLIAMTVMMNVAAMNFSYDIPVKIFSVNLVLLAVYLAAYDLKRIINVFFLNKTADPANISMPQPKRWKRILQWSLKTIAILFALYATLGAAIDAERKYGEDAPKPPLYGIYNVQQFIKGKDTLAPLTTDTARWRQMIVSYPGSVLIKNMADSINWMKLDVDTVKHALIITSPTDSTIIWNFSYSNPDKERLLLCGRINNDSTFISMKRFDEKEFNLMKRGFHWINEYPNNR